MKHLAQNPFGTVDVPVTNLGTGANPGLAIGKVIQLVINLLIIGAAIYALINLIVAGYSFMSAGGDSKKVADAWARIWQTLLGLTVAAGAFVLAAIFGQLLFNDPGFLLRPTLPAL
jgi:hypothetical protein